MSALRWIDTSRSHKWICDLPAHYSGDELIEEFSRAMDALRQLPLGQRLVVLTDLSKAVHSDSRRRQRIAQFMADNRVLIGRRVVAWGFVAGGIMRGALTALSWIHAFPVPMRVFGNRRDCDAWLDMRLAAERKGQPITDDDDGVPG
jgi:hypothetical protein